MDHVKLKELFFLLLKNWKNILLSSIFFAIASGFFHQHFTIYKSQIINNFKSIDDYHPNAIKNKYYSEITNHPNPLDLSYLSSTTKVIANLATFFQSHDLFQSDDPERLIVLSSPKWWSDNLFVIYDQILLHQLKVSQLESRGPSKKINLVVEVILNAYGKTVADARDNAIFANNFLFNSLIFIESDLYLNSIEALNMEQVNPSEKITFMSYLNTVHASSDIYKKNPFMLNSVLKDALKITKSKVLTSKDMDMFTVNILDYGLSKIDNTFGKRAFSTLPIINIPGKSIYFNIFMGAFFGFVFMCTIIFLSKFIFSKRII